jgi:hypothetical protein
MPLHMTSDPLVNIPADALLSLLPPAFRIYTEQMKLF